MAAGITRSNQIELSRYRAGWRECGPLKQVINLFQRNMIFPLKERKSAVLLFPYSPCFRSSMKSFKKLNLGWLFHHVYSVNTALDHVVVVVFFFPFVTKKMLFVLKTVTGLPSSLF